LETSCVAAFKAGLCRLYPLEHVAFKNRPVSTLEAHKVISWFPSLCCFKIQLNLCRYSKAVEKSFATSKSSPLAACFGGGSGAGGGIEGGSTACVVLLQRRGCTG
jgi:hypothetical protein